MFHVALRLLPSLPRAHTSRNRTVLARVGSSVATEFGLVHYQSFANSRLNFITAWNAAETFP